MKRTLSVAGVVGALVLSVVAMSAARGAADSADESAWRAAEVARIQEHLAGAERALLERDVSALTPGQRAARQRNVQLLRQYRDRGEFPRNIDFAGQKVPYFRDDRGVLCAMAYLIAESGRGDIVEHVHSTRNNAYVHELTDEPALLEWLERAGLSVDEAARIQPAYNGDPWRPPSPANTDRRDYAWVTAATATANVGVLALNVADRRQPSILNGVLALATGSASMWLATAAPSDTHVPTAVAINAGLGALTAAVGTHTLARRAYRSTRSTPNDPSAPVENPSRRDVALIVSPMGVTLRF